jgi:hypothetical protein
MLTATGTGKAFFQHTAFVIINISLFALTNGYVSTLLMIYGPMAVKQDIDREKAGQIMSFSLVFGIFIGTVIASYGLALVL